MFIALKYISIMNRIGTDRSPSRPAALLGTVALGVRKRNTRHEKSRTRKNGRWERKFIGFPVIYAIRQ